jgi:hypothetical protein
MERRILFSAFDGESRPLGYVMVLLCLALMIGPNGLRPPGSWGSSVRMLATRPLEGALLLAGMLGWEALMCLLGYAAFMDFIAPRRIEGTFTGFEVLENPTTGKKKISIGLQDRNIVVAYHSALEESLRNLVAGGARIAILAGAFGYIHSLEETAEKFPRPPSAGLHAAGLVAKKAVSDSPLVYRIPTWERLRGLWPLFFMLTILVGWAFRPTLFPDLLRALLGREPFITAGTVTVYVLVCLLFVFAVWLLVRVWIRPRRVEGEFKGIVVEGGPRGGRRVAVLKLSGSGLRAEYHPLLVQALDSLPTEGCKITVLAGGGMIIRIERG